jgi:hypothetical protein
VSQGSIDFTNQRFTQATAYSDQQLVVAKQYAARGIAASSAIPQVAPSETGRTAVALGSGYYDGESAVGISMAHTFRNRMSVAGGAASVSGGKKVARLAVGFEF